METVQLGIIKIKETEFYIDESIQIESPDLISINFEVGTNVNVESRLIDFILSVRYNYGKDNLNFLRIRTSNVFVVPNIAEFSKNEEQNIIIPDVLLTTILSLSISHTRALLAKNTIGSAFSDFYIPIVNPTELAKDLFQERR